MTFRDSSAITFLLTVACYLDVFLKPVSRGLLVCDINSAEPFGLGSRLDAPKTPEVNDRSVNPTSKPSGPAIQFVIAICDTLKCQH